MPYACSSSSTSLLSILTFPAPPVQSLAVQFIMVAIKLLEELSTLPSDIPASGKSERRTRYYSLFITVKRYHVQVSEKRPFRMTRMLPQCSPFIRQAFKKRYGNRHWKPSFKFWRKRTTLSKSENLGSRLPQSWSCGGNESGGTGKESVGTQS